MASIVTEFSCDFQIARRMSHRMMLIFRQPNLLSIDGIPVSNEERSKAEIHFLEQQVISSYKYFFFKLVRIL